MLSAFCAQNGYQDDGHCSPRTWTQVTDGAARGALGWMRRLAGHPAVSDALATAGISESRARRICDWTDTLPRPHAPTPTSSCWAAPTWPIWVPWPRSCANGSRGPTPRR